MNFLDDKGLALRFKNGKVSQFERLLYFVCFALLKMTPFYFSSTLATNFKIQELGFVGGELTENPVFPFFGALTSVTLYAWVVTILILVIGIICCYNSNRAGDDKEFVERFISIGFPIFIQVSLMSFIVSIVNIFIFSREQVQGFENIVLETYETMCVSNIILMLYFFWRLSNTIKIAAGSKKH